MAQKNNIRPKNLLPVTMELIRSGKRKIQIPANEIKSTLQKYIRQTVE